jgi:hypothetical protein
MRDEHYVLDLCDRVLRHRSHRQHRFEFLRGDSGRSGQRGRTLPVDAYYPALNLVIEFRERQHFEAHPFFDRKMTVSGPRPLQRKKYDRRRARVLRAHGITLVALRGTDFPHDPRTRLKRDRVRDLLVIRRKLARILSRMPSGTPARR